MEFWSKFSKFSILVKILEKKSILVKIFGILDFGRNFQISDHYLCFAILEICKKVKYQPKYITLNAWNEEAYALFYNEVATSMNEWNMESDLFADRTTIMITLKK